MADLITLKSLNDYACRYSNLTLVQAKVRLLCISARVIQIKATDPNNSIPEDRLALANQVFDDFAHRDTKNILQEGRYHRKALNKGKDALSADRFAEVPKGNLFTAWTAVDPTFNANEVNRSLSISKRLHKAIENHLNYSEKILTEQLKPAVPSWDAVLITIDWPEGTGDIPQPVQEKPFMGDNATTQELLKALRDLAKSNQDIAKANDNANQANAASMIALLQEQKNQNQAKPLKPEEIGLWEPETQPDASSAQMFLQCIDDAIAAGWPEERIRITLRACCRGEVAKEWILNLTDDEKSELRGSIASWKRLVKRDFIDAQDNVLISAMDECFKWDQKRTPLSYATTKVRLLRLAGFKEEQDLVKLIDAGIKEPEFRTAVAYAKGSDLAKYKQAMVEQTTACQKVWEDRQEEDKRQRAKEKELEDKLRSFQYQQRRGGGGGGYYNRGYGNRRYFHGRSASTPNLSSTTTNSASADKAKDKDSSSSKDKEANKKTDSKASISDGKGGKRKIPSCWTCGKEGHWARNCPEKKNIKEEKSFVAAMHGYDRDDLAAYMEFENSYFAELESRDRLNNAIAAFYGDDPYEVDDSYYLSDDNFFGFEFEEEQLTTEEMNDLSLFAKDPELSTLPNIPSSWICNVCDQSFPSNNALFDHLSKRNHMKSANPSEPDIIRRKEKNAYDDMDPDLKSYKYAEADMTFTPNGKTYNTVVDSGMGQSAISAKLVKELEEAKVDLTKGKLPVPVAYAGFTNNPEVLQETVTLRSYFKVGKKHVEITNTYLISPSMPADVIIANDCICREMLLVDVPLGTITFRAHDHLQLRIRVVKDTRVKNGPIRAANKVVIPPNHRMNVSIRLPKRLSDRQDYMFTPAGELQNMGLQIPSAVFSGSQKGILVFNSSDLPITINRNRLLGTIESVPPGAKPTVYRSATEQLNCFFGYAVPALAMMATTPVASAASVPNVPMTPSAPASTNVSVQPNPVLNQVMEALTNAVKQLSPVMSPPAGDQSSHTNVAPPVITVIPPSPVQGPVDGKHEPPQSPHPNIYLSPPRANSTLADMNFSPITYEQDYISPVAAQQLTPDRASLRAKVKVMQAERTNDAKLNHPELSNKARTMLDTPFKPTYKHPIPPGIKLGPMNNSTWPKVNINQEDDIASHEIEALQALAKRHAGLFNDKPGIVREPEENWMEIPVEHESNIKARPPLRLSKLARDAVDKDFTPLKESGRISNVDPGGSPYSLHVFVVKHPQSHKHRSVVDMRPLNNDTLDDAYPLPRQEDITDRVAGKPWLSIFDIKSSYYQRMVKSAHRYRTAMVTHRGHEMFNVVPMGCKRSVAHQQKFMDGLFPLKMRHFVCAYVDDIVVFSLTFEEHLFHCDEVMTILEDTGTTLSAEKCYMGFHSVELLGKYIDRFGLTTLASRAQAIHDLEPPDTLSRLSTFIGLMSWNQTSIPFFSQRIHKLQTLKTKLLSNAPKSGRARKMFESSCKVTLDKDQMAEFEDLKKALPAALFHFDPTKALYIFCDNSREWGRGVAAYQIRHELDDVYPPKESDLVPNTFLSKELKNAERSYWPPDLEFSGMIWGCKKLEHWIEQAPKVYVFTDHQPLEGICKPQSLTNPPATIKAATARANARHLEWAVWLSQFSNLRIIYKKGIEMVVPDALSRLRRKMDDRYPETPREEPEDGYIGVTIELEQDFKTAIIDSYDEEMVSELSSAPLNDDNMHQLPNSLFKLDPNTNFIYFCDPRNGVDRVFVPGKEEQKQLLHMSHDDLGHHGADRTIQRLRQHFYWKKMGKAVENYVKFCPACLKNKTLRHKPYGRLQPIYTPELPFETITLDFITDLPSQMFRGIEVNALLVVTDKFSKAKKMIPGRKDWTAEQWAEAYHNDIYPSWGYPATSISDRDPKFMSAFWKSLFTLARVKWLTTTAYHPAADGQSERSNQEVEIALRFYVDAYQEKWADSLPLLERAFASHPSSTTSKSPDELLYGMKLRSAIDLAAASASTDKRALTVAETRETARSDANDAIAFAAKAMKHFFDKRHVWPNFDSGKAYISIKHGFTLPSVRKAKLGPQRVGPYRIIRKVGKGNALELDLPDSMKIHPVISIAHLEPYPEGEDQFGRHMPPPEPILVEGEPEWEVEEIVGKRRTRKGRGPFYNEYLVRWTGYGEDFNEWIKEKDIFAPEKVQEYEDRANGRGK